MTTTTEPAAADSPPRSPTTPVAPPVDPDLAGPTERDRIRALGQPVSLADGRELAVRFGLDELCRLEETFGSLAAFTEAINAARPGSDGPVLTTIRRALVAGLARHGITSADLDSLFMLEHRWDYRGAIVDAYNEALPPLDGTGKASAETSSSRGATSTTPEPSRSAEPNPPSGE